ncbi:MAG: hypothetical protein ABI670_00085 [Chloroflexota bacterium]
MDNNKDKLPPQRIALYIALQCLTLAGCWIWFAIFWSIAFFNYTLGDIEWWVLVAIACAGLYGLRPNLERAIDAAWLQGVKNTQALADRMAQLKPVKRRIDMLFSIVVLVLFVIGIVVWFALSSFVGDVGGTVQ